MHSGSVLLGEEGGRREALGIFKLWKLFLKLNLREA